MGTRIFTLIIELVVIFFLAFVGRLIKKGTFKKAAKREVPQGMYVMFENSAQLYALYAIPVVMLFIVGLFVLIALFTGGLEAVNIYMFVVIGISVLSVVLIYLLKHFIDKRQIMWDDEKIILVYAIGQRRVLTWYEISRVVERTSAGWTEGIGLYVYGRDGEKLFNAPQTMVNYGNFYRTMKEKRGYCFEQK